jgi:hypothetical protein
LADGNHRRDSGDSDDNAQDGQPGSKFVFAKLSQASRTRSNKFISSPSSSSPNRLSAPSATGAREVHHTRDDRIALFEVSLDKFSKAGIDEAKLNRNRTAVGHRPPPRPIADSGTESPWPCPRRTISRH